VTREWRCHTCGELHTGVPLDWGFDAPIYWKWLSDEQRSDGQLTDDVCVFNDGDQDNFCVRGMLEIPLLDGDGVLGYGVWSTLSEANFERTLELWDDPERVNEPPYFGWLANRLPGYPDTLSLKLDVVTRPVELRPALLLHGVDHPLALEQRSGITFDRVLEIAELNMHDDVGEAD
jgi:hypothetical protein